MSWQTDMTLIVRYLINDLDSANYTYTDGRVQESIVVAAQLSQKEIEFGKVYVLNLAAKTIVPDPTAATRDDAFINLVSLRAACVILGGVHKDAVNNGILFKDGLSVTDMRERAKLYGELHKQRCAEYEDAKNEYVMGNLTPGEAIIGPFAGPNVWTGSSHNENFRRRI